MTELWKFGALDLAKKIRTGETPSREVVEAHLTRVAAVNPELNAVVRLLDAEALDAADKADKAVAAGNDLGPFHGVPFSVKENIDVVGHPTTRRIRVTASPTCVA